jgi:hypothetical protein
VTVALTLQQAKQRIDAIMLKYQTVAVGTGSVLTGALTSGKTYEAWVLANVLEHLRLHENFQVSLVGGSKVVLKSSPGPINSAYAHFVLQKPGEPQLEVWTDVEFTTLSHGHRGSPTPIEPADRHELDIVVVPASTVGWPSFQLVRLGVECKNTSFAKHMWRAALGVRRELSVLRAPISTGFVSWPRASVPAQPPSVLMVFSTDPAVTNFAAAGSVFGIDVVHCPM